MPQNPETMGPQEPDRTPEQQIAAFLKEYHPGDACLQDMRSQMSASKVLLLLKLMATHSHRFAPPIVTNAVH